MNRSRWPGSKANSAETIRVAAVLKATCIEVIGSITKVPEFKGASRAGFDTITTVNGLVFVVSPGLRVVMIGVGHTLICLRN
jgi:hypothetical protein